MPKEEKNLKKSVKKPEAYSDVSIPYLIWGLFLGYIVIYPLIYVGGRVLAVIIYAILPAYLMNAAHKRDDRKLRGIAIGMLGTLLGFFINWSMGLT